MGEQLAEGSGSKSCGNWGYISYSNLYTGVVCTLSECVDGAKLGGAIDSLQGREALQRDLSNFECYAITSRMKYKKQVSDSAPTME